MAEQLSLDLPRRAALGREDFFVAAGNSNALTMLDNWRDWPLPRLALTGPRGAGKSHLARVWAAESAAMIVEFDQLADMQLQDFAPEKALVIEDADRIDLLDQEVAGRSERALLHVHNLLGEAATPLLLTGCGPPSRWAIALPDLASRLAAMPVARIEAPDSQLLEVMLVKLFADRQIAVTPDLIAYLLVRIDRDGNAAERVVEALDRASLRERRAVTRPFAADVLQRLGVGSGPS